MYEYFTIKKKKKNGTRTQNKIMKKGIRKITSKTYWKKEESNGDYWEVDKRKIPKKKKNNHFKKFFLLSCLRVLKVWIKNLLSCLRV